MAFRLSMLLGVDADQAKAELGQTKQAIDQTKTAAKGLNTDGRSAAQGVNTLGRSADRTEAELRQMAAAERQAAMQAQGLGNTSNAAAGQIGNLTAQFNDIGVMMMAGQSPFQLAVQQGTQITQVIGPMGAAGAARALGSAFLSMLSPINFVILGSIAAAAAMSNWLRGGKEEARTLVDEIEALQEAHEAYAKAVKDARTPTVDLAARFGADADAAREYLRVVAEVRRREALLAAERAREMFVGDTQIGEVLSRQQRRNQSMFELDDIDQLTEMRTGGPGALINRLIIAYREIEGVADQSTSAQISAWEQLYQATEAAAAAVDGYSAEENERLLIIGEQIVRLRELQEIERQRDGMRSEGDGPIYDPADLAAAEKLTATFRERERIASLIALFGRDSLEVSEAQVEAERAAQAEAINALDVSEQKKQELLAALDAALGIEGSNMAASIAAGADEAARLAENLGAALRNAASLAMQGTGDVDRARIEYEYRSDPVGRARALAGMQFDSRTALPEGTPGFIADQAGSEIAAQRQEFIAASVEAEQYRQKRLEALKAEKASSRGDSRRKTATDREREAVERLLEREREQLDLIRETDPLQKELIRNREILAAATDGERAAIEEVIRARIQEQEALDQSRERMGLYRDMIDGAILRSESLGDVLRNTLLPALYQAAMWGDGPLGSIFGGGSLLGAIFPALEMADGGYVTGRGGARDDRVPILGSAGEFMMNADATARYRHLLEHLNSGGDLPRLADGGMIGAPRSRASMTGAGQGAQDVLRVELSPDLRASFLQESTERTMQIVDEYGREAVPDIARASMKDPRSQSR